MNDEPFEEFLDAFTSSTPGLSPMQKQLAKEAREEKGEAIIAARKWQRARRRKYLKQEKKNAAEK